MNQQDRHIINRALELVRDGLRSGEIPAHNFDMRTWRDGHHCGTVGCIGGWAEAALRKARKHRAADIVLVRYDSLDKLFYAYTHPKWEAITPQQAAAAIDRYLAGRAPWPRRAA